MQWKYNEDAILNELREYISKTYQQHYSAGDDRIQTLDAVVTSLSTLHVMIRKEVLEWIL